MPEPWEREKYNAAIFRRGQKKELFEDGDEDVDEEIDLNYKLEDLYGVWSLPRTGYVRCELAITGGNKNWK